MKHKIHRNMNEDDFFYHCASCECTKSPCGSTGRLDFEYIDDSVLFELFLKDKLPRGWRI